MEQDIFSSADFTIPAGQTTARFPITGTLLRVFSAPTPLRFALVGKSGTERLTLSPGMGRRFKPDNGFQYIEIERTAADTSAALTCSLGYGTGEVYDNRAVADITNTNAVTVKVDNVTALPVAPTTARFLPKYTAKVNLMGVAKYVADDTAAPKVTGGAAAPMNLLAPATASAVKRIIRLLSGTDATIGFGNGAAGPSVPGHFIALSSASRPEVEIPGGSAIVGTSAGDCTFSVLEVNQSATAVPAAGTVTANLSAAEIALLPPPSLDASISYTFSAGTALASFDGEGYIKRNAISSAANWPTIYTGTVGYQTAGGSNTGSPANPNGTNVISFAGLLSADAGLQPTEEYAPAPLANHAHVCFRISATTAGKKIIFSNGQAFTLTTSGGNHEKFFRVAFPYDESAPIVQQLTASGWVTAS